MNIERALGHAHQAMITLPRVWIVGLALSGVAVVGMLDFWAGLEVSLSVFYLFPVAIASWYAGRNSGVLISLLSTLSALAGELSEGHFYVRPGLMLWNGFLHLGFMLIVVFLLHRLHVYIENEHELARSDHMTGLFNRRAFFEKLQHRLALSQRERQPISLAYLDLDDFKRINDEGGHEEGDRVLRLVAITLIKSVRRTDLVARLGGDEFALLLNGTDRAAAEGLIAKVRQHLQQAFDSERATVTCSVGCVTFNDRFPGVDDAIRSADLLMYHVKSRGKNAVAFEVFDQGKGVVAQFRI